MQISVIDRTARRRGIPRGRFAFQSPMTPQQAVDNWNSNVRVGAPVTYWQRDGCTVDTETCGRAELRGEHAVIRLYRCNLAELDRVLMR